MKKQSRLVAAIAAASIGCAAFGAAPALPKSTVAAAKIDFAKARSLPATSKAIDCLFAEVPELKKSERLISQATGSGARDSISSIVIAADGFSFDGKTVSLSNPSTIANGSFDTDKLAATIRASQGVRRAKASDMEVMSSPLTRGYWFAFPAAGTVMVSSSDSGISKLAAASAGKSKAPFAARALGADCPAVAAIDGSNGAANLSLFFGGIDANTIVAKLTEATPGTARLDIDMVFADENLAAQAFASINGIKMLSAFKQTRVESSLALLQRFIESDLSIDGATVRLRMFATADDFASLAK